MSGTVVAAERGGGGGGGIGRWWCGVVQVCVGEKMVWRGGGGGLPSPTTPIGTCFDPE